MVGTYYVFIKTYITYVLFFKLKIMFKNRTTTKNPKKLETQYETIYYQLSTQTLLNDLKQCQETQMGPGSGLKVEC